MLCYCPRRVQLDDTVKVADVDAQLQRAGRNNHAVACFTEGTFRVATLLRTQRAVGDEGRYTLGPEISGHVFCPGTAIAKHEPLLTPMEDLQNPGSVLEIADEIDLNVCFRRWSPGGATITDSRVEGPDSQLSSFSGFPTVADSPIRCVSRSVMCRMRSRTASRCQPRSSPANAWISSTTIARTDPKKKNRSVRREINSASKLSGVVRRMSGGSASVLDFAA
jgi:hypothetical protein